MPALRISEAEYQRRRTTILDRLGERGITGLVLFSPNNVGYYGRFAFAPTERPIAFLFTRDTSVLLVPHLEIEHAEEFALVDKVVTYPEYPGERHPMDFLKDQLVEAGLQTAKIGVDSDGYGRIYGYRGPSVSVLLPDATVENVMDDVEYQQMINTEEELAIIRESCKWGNLAHELLQEYSKVGEIESSIAARASYDASQQMVKELGPEYRAFGFGRTGAYSGFRGQVGKASALPHALSNNAALQAGDILVTYAGAPIWGYDSELERTMVMGEPSAEQIKYFNHMFNAQTIALETIKPGIPCSEVDKKVREYFVENGLMETWRHHSGHAKSMLIHEAPFLDIGDHRLLEVGMVFTVEPGIYVSDFAGFRHSDTVAVTETGFEFLTFYPRDLESLIIAI